VGRIALLEDNADSADLIQIILSDYHVEWFSMARPFLESFATNPFDLILLDISLPDTDGYDVYHSIRQINPNIPVIVISAHAQPEAIKEALEIGACDYITKPIIDVDAFREIVRQNVAHTRQQ
jgi:two-component system NtrC family response regulator